MERVTLQTSDSASVEILSSSGVLDFEFSIVEEVFLVVERGAVTVYVVVS